MSQLQFPMIRDAGLTGVLISFGDTLSEPSNRATLAFRRAIDASDWAGVLETSTSLASVFVRFDPAELPHATLNGMLADLLSARDWYAADLPEGRRLWHVPTVYGTDLAPQLEEAAAAAGVSPEEAIAELSTSRVRVLTIGFAPGQPYLGSLSDRWDIPRQTELTAEVPAGALVVAIRQFVLFTGPAPTGWRHAGQTLFRNYRPGTETPFALRPGDEMLFPAISAGEYADIQTRDVSGNGGAQVEEIPA